MSPQRALHGGRRLARPAVLPKRRRMTREEFDRFVTQMKADIYVRPPYDVVPCHCGDINCHGWRFVEVRAFREDGRTIDVDAAGPASSPGRS